MGPPGHAPGAAWSKPPGEDLDEEPISEKDESRYFKELEKEKDGNQGKDLRTGIEKKISAHDTGNGAARPDRGDLGTPDS